MTEAAPSPAPPGDPIVSVLVVSYNTREKTLACLASIPLGDAPTPPHVIVVDNGSEDGSAEAIRAAHPEATVIEAGDNLGFARGVNRGVAAATERFVLLLNPDTLVLEGSFRALLEFAVANPRYGVYGGRTLRPDGSVVDRTERRTQDVVVETVDLKTGTTPGLGVGEALRVATPFVTVLGVLWGVLLRRREKVRPA